MLNTDLLPPGGTLTLAFLPTTPGNWLFHCHFSFHMNDEVTLSGSPRDSAEAAHPMPRHEGAPYMRGLVIGIRVLPKAGYVAYSAVNPRELRLLVQKKAMQLPGNADAYGFVLQAGDSVPEGFGERPGADARAGAGAAGADHRGEPSRGADRDSLARAGDSQLSGRSTKDGADLQPALATRRVAHVEMGPGETADFEFTPTAPGEWRLEVKTVESGWYIPLTVIVAAAPRHQGRP
jgi:hypothetical protein